MAETVSLELVSPEKLLMSEEVEMAILPGSEGDLGVLPGHSPVIATVRPGTIAVFKGSKVEKRIFVAGGFLEITPERCTVLAETAIAVEEIDQTATRQEISDLQDDVKVAKNDAERNKAEAALAVAEAKLDAATSPAYA